ncbi:MAG TPA: hypothetical protein VGN82_02360 [Bosea sp. (in: a-proteobacteria)]|jgi:hypothetical protein|uniref:hypothetical protein n=1 Tax=Bosea sp. (in: a-proteobacteria) TaxID=1871050 RepID=UPI002E1275DC|nr:hypothetical protein [Bosea sp. (in: a-proteobacteria)]
MRAHIDLDAIPVEIRRAACAHHEAGHIVVGWHHRRYITHAWLRPPHGITGETCFLPYQRGFQPGRKEDAVRAEVEVVILSAGYCGEMIYWNAGEGLKWYPGEIQSHHDDLEQMRPYLAFLRPQDQAAFRDRCARAATAILYDPRMLAAQKAIARALFERRRVDADETDAMIRAELPR